MIGRHDAVAVQLWGGAGAPSPPAPAPSPTLTNDTASGPEDAALTGNVLTNDSVPSGTLLVVYFQVVGVAGLFAAGSTATIPAVGTMSMAANGAWTFTPAANWNGTVPAVTYAVTWSAETRTRTLGVTITPVNDAPTAVGDSFTTAYETPFNFTPLGNDTDPEGSTLNITHVNGAAITSGGNVAVANGSVTLNANKSLTFSPNTSYSGSFTFTYTVSDGTLPSTATVTATVSAAPSSGGFSTFWDPAYAGDWTPDIGVGASAVPALSKPARATTTPRTPAATDTPSGMKFLRVTAVSDVPVNGSGVASYYVRHEYSRRQPYNQDSSLRIAQSTPGFWWLYDATTNERLNAGATGVAPEGIGSIVGMVGDCEPFWSVASGEKDIIIHSARGGGLIWWKRNARTGVIVETRNFTTRIRAMAGFSDADSLTFNGEGGPSDDQRYWFWSVEHYVGNDPVTRGYVRYDWLLDTFGPHLQHANGNKPNWVSSSPDGDRGILSFYGSAAADLATENARALSAAGGVRSFKWDFSEYNTLSVLGEHSDLGWDAYGNPVYIAVSFHGAADGVTDGSVWYCRLDNPSLRYTLPINAYNSPDTGDTGTHVSGRATVRRPGLAFVGRYNNAGNNPHDAKTNVVELVPSGARVYRLPYHHSTGGDYWFEPHPCPNWDATRALVASNWGDAAGEDYELGIPSWTFRTPGLVAMALTAAPTVSGTATPGGTLTAVEGTFSGFPVPTVAGIWQVSTDGGTVWTDSTSGLTSPTLGANGTKYRRRSTGTQDATNLVSYSNVVTVAALAAPVNTVAPSAPSTSTDSQVTTMDLGTWAGNPVPDLSPVWQRNISSVWTDSAFTTAAATLTPAGQWRGKVSASNSQGGPVVAYTNTVTVSAVPLFIQAAGPFVGTQTASQALTLNVAVGDLVVVDVVQTYGANPPRAFDKVYDSVDGIGNTYTPGPSRVNGSGNLRVDMFYRFVTTAGARTITSLLAAAGAQSIVVTHYRTVTAAGPSSVNGGTGTAATPGSVSPTGGAVYHVCVGTTTSYDAVTPDTAGGWNERAEIEFGGPTINVHDKLGTGAQNPTTTLATSVEWAAAQATFT